MTPVGEPVILEPDLTAEAIEMDVLPLTRRLRAQLDRGRAAHRLPTILAALRGFEHLASIVGLELAASAFAKACRGDEP